MKKLEWTLVEKEDLVKDQWMHFKKSYYKFPDGAVHGPFYTYSIRSYVIIVAQDTKGNFVCVRQYRQGIGATTIEFPAGGIEAKEVDVPTALLAAQRELREETGYVSEDWRFVLQIPSHATLGDNYAYIFFAKNCEKKEDLDLDETEFLEPRCASQKEIESWIQDGSFAQANHVLAWLLWKQGGIL